MKFLERWYLDPLPRFVASAGVTIVPSWMWVYEYTQGTQYNSLLYLSLTALLFMAVDVGGFILYWLWEQTNG